MTLKPLYASLAVCLAIPAFGAARPDVNFPKSPDQLFGPLYADVERSAVFPDQKSFADCVPKRDPAAILADYRAQKASGKPIDLKAFVGANFLIPEPPPTLPKTDQALAAHLSDLWDTLVRRPDTAVAGSSLLPLSHPYVVPGGRFREVYYWDSYFTMLGLRVSGREELIESMTDNFASLIQNYGFVPNGNRTYYLTRSQPPFFALMVELVAEKEGPKTYIKYLSALEKEYEYWTDKSFPTHHLVEIPGCGVLDRYYDRATTPRPEAFSADEAVARSSKEAPPELYRNLRSAAESGWDFSSRWFADGRSLATIETTQIVPVDLNALLWQQELTLAKAYQASGRVMDAARLTDEAAMRKAALMRACWYEESGFFADARLSGPGQVPLTLAGMMPLFLKMADAEQADAAAKTIAERFLRPGGVVTTLTRTGQQWDAPNGWAHLEWITISGLRSYGKTALAETIARRWIALNQQVYRQTGKMMEKYDVEDLSKPGGGGEYPSQDGFGWTNGVLLKLMDIYAEKAPAP